MAIGFKSFRKPEEVSNEALKLAIERMGFNDNKRFIYWTGNPYHGRTNSLRRQALACVRQKRTPIPMKKWLTDAARALEGGKMGWNPAVARQGLTLHAGAKPCTYIELEVDEKGNYRAVMDIPNPDPSIFTKPIKKGQIVHSADTPVEGKALPSPKGKGKQKAPVMPGVEATSQTESEQPEQQA